MDYPYKKLIDTNYEIILLGGPQEDERNKEIAQRTGAEYNGYVPMHKFIEVVDQCDIIVTGVTMALHIAIGLKKQIVVMNNIFNNMNLNSMVEEKSLNHQ
jgi:ADP-heptose:LPS heptosyltransferase